MSNNCVRRIRRAHEETQEELATAVGVSRQTIIDIEKGYTKRPSDELILKIANHYHTPVVEIFFTPLVKQVTQNAGTMELECLKTAK